ncbi:glycosyltransferase family 39 protein [Streptomyces sp. NPDC051162]|uniref:ArnT family glycosyltransferase n=1 Tax=unclassified Streptomyces TaxID=2593676 RepID=UPI0034253BC9
MAALATLLIATALLYLWALDKSGYANSFYAAAAQAGSASWKAFFFGASDAASAITVDKPPASLWPMGLSVRIFGLSSWAILVPEALMGVAAVGVLYASVRRYFGQAAGLLAGVALAVTPVAALMFRFDNPDALLCLLMVCAVACVLRALETAGTRWLLLAGLCFGLGFLTKTLQAWLILPPLALLYACCAPVAPLRRVRQLLLAGLVLVVSGGWWVAAVELWPASSRPYIGGSQHNSFLELTFGYNGLGRINGNERGSVGGGGGAGGGRWGDTGITRLFGTDMGGQIAWLLPAALVLLVAGLWLLRRAEGRDRMRRLAFLAWGGAMLMTFLIFSFMSGIFHQYYNIALAPYVSALFAAGAALLWKRKAYPLLALVTVGTAGWAYVLLDRTPHWLPWLRWAVLAAGVLAGGALLLVRRSGKVLARGAAVLAAGSALAAPFAYTLDTVNTGHGGSIVTAGPSLGRGHFGGRGGHFTPGGMPGGRGGGPGGAGGPAGAAGTGKEGAGAHSGFGRNGKAGGGMSGGMGGGMPGGMGGLLGGQKVSAAAAAALKRNAGDYTWPAAAVGSQNAASYQLATQVPVMSVGGFNGSDPSPTLRQFQAYVKAGKVHWFIASGESRGGAWGGGRGGEQGGGRGGRGGPSAEITSWVTAHFAKVTVGTATFYDLTKAR